jgi:AAA domain/Bifunctional DNA primase/polymerase, N-terminal
LPEDIVVIDLDMKRGKNGIKEFETLQGCNPNQFDAPRVATATGGIHIYTDASGRDFQLSRDKIALGVDTRTVGGYVIIPSGPQSGYRWLSDPDTRLPPAPQWAEVTLRRTSNFEFVAEARTFQGTSLYGNALLASACEAIKSAPDGKQEETLNDRSFQMGRFVAGGLLERDATIVDLIKAGLHMVDYDPGWEWSEKEIEDKVSRAVDKGKLKPLDGEESFREMQAVHERYLNNPLLHDDVMELLLDDEEKAEKPSQPSEEPQQEQPQDEQPKEQPQQEPPSQEPWLKPGERLLIQRLGKGVPPPVPFLVDGLFHEVGTGSIVSKYLGGKTFVAFSLAASVACGLPFAGRSVMRRGAVLWLAAEGEREVDKRMRAAVKALGCDPDEQPLYKQIASVPKLLSNGGEALIMQIVNQVQRAAKAEFGLLLVLIIIDTMIKSAGYKKSENDAVEINNMIQVMENISIRTKCFVLALDHMGKDEERGARGSSDKPSSVDVYIELKSNGGAARTFHAIKVKGEKGDDPINFQIVGTTLEDGQTTAYVRWEEWNNQNERFKSLNDNAALLLNCIRDVIAREGETRTLFHSMPDIRCVQKISVSNEFSRKHKGGRHDMAFKRSWKELVAAGLVTTKKNKDNSDDMADWVYLE